MGELVDTAEKHGFVEKSGTWYSVDGNKIDTVAGMVDAVIAAAIFLAIMSAKPRPQVRADMLN